MTATDLVRRLGDAIVPQAHNPPSGGGSAPLGSRTRLRTAAARMLRHLGNRVKHLSAEPPRLALRIAHNTTARSLTRSSLPVEIVNDSVLTLGLELRDRVIAEYLGKYSNTAFRILISRPQNGVGAVWFADLTACLQHVGIAVMLVDAHDPTFRDKWQRFHPNVFIAIDSTETLAALDLVFIAEYKKEHGCLRLLTPTTTHRFPLSGCSSEDRTRLALATSGMSADAYFSMMEPEFFQLFFVDWLQRGFKYFAIPCAANPFRHFPVRASKDLDYLVVTSCNPEKVRVSHDFLLPIVKHYYGIWAGTDWGFGMGPLVGGTLNYYYARARIAPAPLVRSLREFPCEVSERAFSGPACGGFMLTNPTPVTSRFFEPTELALSPSPREFVDAFGYYARRPDDRTGFVIRGMTRVFTQHTYFHRIDRLVEVLSECSKMF